LQNQKPDSRSINSRREIIPPCNHPQQAMSAQAEDLITRNLIDEKPGKIAESASLVIACRYPPNQTPKARGALGFAQADSATHLLTRDEAFSPAIQL
jgi:hypothetical protein